MLQFNSQPLQGTYCDILIVGGGTGGVAAYGLKVILTEEYEWVGGQLTSQGVPPDEHPWIERTGCTASYRDFRNRVRAFYREGFPMNDAVREMNFNPGGGFVSGLCHEPRIAHAVLLDMLRPPIAENRLTVRTGLIPIGADVDGDKIKAIQFKDLLTGRLETITASMLIDCTELGDLLPLAGVEYVSGAESKAQTGELHAGDVPDENDVQGLTWCFAAGYDPHDSHIIDRPIHYDFWRKYVPNLIGSPWPGPLIDWTAVSPITLEPRTFDLFVQPGAPYNSLWNYRKIVSSENLAIDTDDVTLVNWPQNDYFIRNIIDQPAEVKAKALSESRQLSLSLLYWMQTEAPRPDGGAGYPGLYLNGAVMGTSDGFAMAPYIRESRRIKALFTVTEAHVGTTMRHAAGKDRAEQFDDSVGIGCYRIDLHPTPSRRNYIDISSLPFQIPLGALIPQRVTNLIAGNKNIGVTHITNGCYRLHPVEWNIGESAGHLAGYCLTNKTAPAAVCENYKQFRDFQATLIAAGIELNWPEDILCTSR